MLSETPSSETPLGLLDRELRRRDFLKFCTLAAGAVYLFCLPESGFITGQAAGSGSAG